MKTFTIRLGLSFIMAFPFISCKAEAQPGKGNIVNYESEGNLEVTHQVGCWSFSKLNNKLTPADLYSGLARCLKDENYENAADLVVLAEIYAFFDKLRVADKTAHQAHPILWREAFEATSKDGKIKLLDALDAKLAKGGKQLTETCLAVRKIGRPDYYPSYMIQHGIGAFGSTDSNNGLIADFHPEQAWKKSLDESLHCPSSR